MAEAKVGCGGKGLKTNMAPGATSAAEDELLPNRSPRYYIRSLTHQALVQLIKAEHQMEIPGPGQAKRCKAALSHLDLTRRYLSDAEARLAEYLKVLGL